MMFSKLSGSDVIAAIVGVIVVMAAFVNNEIERIIGGSGCHHCIGVDDSDNYCCIGGNDSGCNLCISGGSNNSCHCIRSSDNCHIGSNDDE